MVWWGIFAVDPAVVVIINYWISGDPYSESGSLAFLEIP